jgi:hypothetical protein
MTDRVFLSLGWWGYFACASVYVFAGLRSGDILNLLGSSFFLVATVAFLIPHYRREAGNPSAEETQS